MKRPTLHVVVGGVVVGELESYRMSRVRPHRFDQDERQTITLRLAVESDHRQLAELMRLLATREETTTPEPKAGQVWRWEEADFEVLRVDGPRLWYRDAVAGHEAFVRLSECTFVREGF